jgi:ribosome-binding ATPase YchF (GTP1/OBG family)
VKTRAKRPARKASTQLQGAVELARERWQAAKKSAKQAKQAAKQARRQFKDAKKALKHAKQAMLTAARKLQSSVMSAARRRRKARAKPVVKAAPPAPVTARPAAKRRAIPKPAPAEVVSTVAIEHQSPVQQETPAT